MWRSEAALWEMHCLYTFPSSVQAISIQETRAAVQLHLHCLKGDGQNVPIHISPMLFSGVLGAQRTLRHLLQVTIKLKIQLAQDGGQESPGPFSAAALSD